MSKLIDFIREVWIGLLKASRLTHCRCCEEELDKIGGYGMAFIGRGFCQRCRDEILRLSRDGKQ